MMATIYKASVIRASADKVWAALAAVGKAHEAFAGVLSDCRLDDGDIRVATFAGGLTVKERIVTIDPERRRVAYAVIESELLHHSASMQVCNISANQCRFVWVTDVLPDDAAEWIAPLVEAGTEALKARLE